MEERVQGSSKRLKPFLETELRRIETKRGAAIEHAKLTDKDVCVTSTASIEGHDWAKVSDGAHHVLAQFRAIAHRQTVRVIDAGLAYGPAVDTNLSAASPRPTLFLVIRDWRLVTIDMTDASPQTTLITDVQKLQGWYRSLAARYRSDPDAIWPADVRPDPTSSNEFAFPELTSAEVRRLEAVENFVPRREPHGDIKAIRQIEEAEDARALEAHLAELRKDVEKPESDDAASNSYLSELPSSPASLPSFNSIKRREKLLEIFTSSPPLQLEQLIDDLAEDGDKLDEEDEEIARGLGVSSKPLIEQLLAASREQGIELSQSEAAEDPLGFIYRGSKTLERAQQAQEATRTAVVESAAYALESPAPPPIAVGQPRPPRQQETPRATQAAAPSTDSTRGHGEAVPSSGADELPSDARPVSPAASIQTWPARSPVVMRDEEQSPRPAAVPASERQSNGSANTVRQALIAPAAVSSPAAQDSPSRQIERKRPAKTKRPRTTEEANETTDAPRKKKKKRGSGRKSLSALDLPDPQALLRHGITHFPFSLPDVFNAPRLSDIIAETKARRHAARAVVAV